MFYLTAFNIVIGSYLLTKIEVAPAPILLSVALIFDMALFACERLTNKHVKIAQAPVTIMHALLCAYPAMTVASLIPFGLFILSIIRIMYHYREKPAGDLPSYEESVGVKTTMPVEVAAILIDFVVDIAMIVLSVISVVASPSILGIIIAVVASLNFVVGIMGGMGIAFTVGCLRTALLMVITVVAGCQGDYLLAYLALFIGLFIHIVWGRDNPIAQVTSACFMLVVIANLVTTLFMARGLILDKTTHVAPAIISFVFQLIALIAAVTPFMYKYWPPVYVLLCVCTASLILVDIVSLVFGHGFPWQVLATQMFGSCLLMIYFAVFYADIGVPNN